MGVQNIWEAILKYKQSLILEDLRCKFLAVDLSIWVCESVNISLKFPNPLSSNFYLRNLFFRIVELYQNQIFLVFIIDGKPPKLKMETINKRLDGGKNFTKTRHRLNKVSNKCIELITLMGLPYYKSKTEAEKLCALLNQKLIVDGCISSDSDIFVYGGLHIFKDIDIKKNKVDFYDSQHIKTSLGLTQDDLIACALLLGCDYFPRGIPGIGKESVFNFLSNLKKNQNSQIKGFSLLDKIYEWRRDPFYTFLVELELCGKHCNSGTKSKNCDCTWHLAQTILAYHKMELNLCKKVLTIPSNSFPIDEVVKEFKCLDNKEYIPTKDELKHTVPDIEGVLNFMRQNLDWDPEYTFEKLFPYLIYHMGALHHFSSEKGEDEGNLFANILAHLYGLKPETIVKTQHKLQNKYFVIRFIHDDKNYKIIYNSKVMLTANNESKIVSNKKWLKTMLKESKSTNQFFEFPIRDYIVETMYPDLITIYLTAKNAKAATNKKGKNLNKKNASTEKTINEPIVNNYLITDFMAKLRITENKITTPIKNIFNTSTVSKHKKSPYITEEFVKNSHVCGEQSHRIGCSCMDDTLPLNHTNYSTLFLDSTELNLSNLGDCSVKTNDMLNNVTTNIVNQSEILFDESFIKETPCLNITENVNYFDETNITQLSPVYPSNMDNISKSPLPLFLRLKNR